MMRMEDTPRQHPHAAARGTRTYSTAVATTNDNKTEEAGRNDDGFYNSSSGSGLLRYIVVGWLLPLRDPWLLLLLQPP